MAGRNFSESIQFGVVKINLEKNNGKIKCELCGKQMFSIGECHFDHIIPYAKGGASTLVNCQILCIDCNLKKCDKELKEIILEEKARQFLSGKSFNAEKREDNNILTENDTSKMSKEKFDCIIGKFIEEKGDIRQIDFSREYNNLPGISYMVKYYGTLNELKKAFGITDISLNWNRKNIKDALEKYVSLNGKITQKDMKKQNGLPSINCILNYYPEYKNFTEIKKGLCNIEARGIWTKEEAIAAGKKFVSVHEVEAAVEEYFGDKERIVESREVFFKSFPYGIDTIRGRYGSFDAFVKRFNITIQKTKKAKYTKQEVDHIISEYVKSGKSIPHHHDLTKEGLPAANAIMRYYEHWREPFEIFQTLYKKMGKT